MRAIIPRRHSSPLDARCGLFPVFSIQANEMRLETIWEFLLSYAQLGRRAVNSCKTRAKSAESSAYNVCASEEPPKRRREMSRRKFPKSLMDKREVEESEEKWRAEKTTVEMVEIRFERACGRRLAAQRISVAPVNYTSGITSLFCDSDRSARARRCAAALFSADEAKRTCS